jgi:hypothetical protein
LSDRLFIGGLKNLLAGVTTVAHHNPLYCAFGLHFPVRIVQRFGWAHSLGLEHGPVGAHGEPGGVVSEKHLATPSDVPFIVHAAEGVDDSAAAEVDELETRGCLKSNTVLVHGLAIAPARWHELFRRGVGLVWCPASNVFLFGRTLCMPCLLQEAPARRRICLGSDSRVTGSRDLLDELRTAARAHGQPGDLMAMVTSVAADVLRLEDAGRIRVGAPADLMVLPAVGNSAGEALLQTSRVDVQLVLRRGTPLVGDPALTGAFTARGVHASDVDVDGSRRLLQTAIVRRIERCVIKEPGVAGR